MKMGVMGKIPGEKMGAIRFLVLGWYLWVSCTKVNATDTYISPDFILTDIDVV